MSRPVPATVYTASGEKLRWCPSCWRERVEAGGSWVIKPRQVRRFKCRECMAKEKPGQKRAA